MIVITTERGTEAWRAAHRLRVCTSDAAAFMARAGTKRRHALIERLVLDIEGIGQHTDEIPDPWALEHETDVAVAVASYRNATGIDVERAGMVASDLLTWLVCSPHGLAEEGVVWTRTKRTLRSFTAKRGTLTHVDRVRAQLMAWICERSWCDVVDIWVPGLGLPDRISITREVASYAWVSENVMPPLVTLWRDVAERLHDRRSAAL